MPALPLAVRQGVNPLPPMIQLASGTELLANDSVKIVAALTRSRPIQVIACEGDHGGEDTGQRTSTPSGEHEKSLG